MAKRTADAKHTLRELLLLQYLGKHPNVRERIPYTEASNTILTSSAAFR